jgi:hypothetical protein
MAKITKVPNGPLVKKKGEFKGSTLKKGGVIKKAANGTTTTSQTTKPPVLTPQQKRAQLDSIAAVRRADIVRKKDSILDRNAAAKGMTREEVRAQQEKDKKKPNVSLPGLQTDRANKRGRTTGSCSTGEANKGECLKDTKKNGGMIKRADGSFSKRGLWDNIRANKGSGKKPTKQMLEQERKIKAKSKK